MSAVNRPYFCSWTAQQHALTLSIDGTSEFHYLQNERQILDFCSTSFQASFGLKNDHITNALSKAAKNLPLAAPKCLFSLKESTSQKLLDLINLPGKIFWTNSGAESVENALKMARDITGKTMIVSREHSYHGASLGALSVGGDWRSQVVQTVDQWSLKIPEPINDPDAKLAREIIEKKGVDQIAAICLETITGGNGVIIPPSSWFEGIQKICDDYHILLILDEVICGLGRTGKDFGFQNYPFLKPDFVCLAKALSGGFFPMGAVWVKDSLAHHYDQKTLPCGLTNYAHPIGLATVDATIDYYRSIKPNFSLFEDLLKPFQSKYLVRQIGFMAAIEIDKKLNWNDFIANDLFIYSKEKMLIIAPALNMPDNILKDGFERLSRSLEQ